jgi:hypothetical protein
MKRAAGEERHKVELKVLVSLMSHSGALLSPITFALRASGCRGGWVRRVGGWMGGRAAGEIKQSHTASIMSESK